MATQSQTGLTYEDLQSFPEDNLRRELIDGELIVTAAPATRHQRVVAKLVHRLYAYCEEHGGEVLPAPFDVYFSDTNVVEPDVVFVRAENRFRLEKKFLRAAPDLAVEVSSPTTRRLELVRKRELYERFGVPEYWFVDLDADRVEVYRLHQNRYGHPLLFARGETIGMPQAPGLALSVDDLLGPPEDVEE
jgi:Uma2 family endonuclease